MRIWAYQVSGLGDLSDDAQLGDTFEIAGTARVVAVEEELTVTVYPGAKHVPVRRATVALEVKSG